MLPLRNLLRRKIRTGITVLGIAVGISLFISALSFSKGFQKQIKDIIKYNQIDIIVQRKNSATPIHSKISWSDYLKLKKSEEIENISSMIIGIIRTELNPYFMLIGTSSDDVLAYRINLLEGRKILSGKKEAIIGQLTAETFNYHINDKLVLSDNEIYTITGIFSTSIRIIDGAAIVDIDDARRILRFQDYANMLFIRLKDNIDNKKVIQNINSNFSELHATKSTDFSGQLRITKTIDAFVWAIILISIFTGCIIVTNTMFMSINERIKEIGILMAIGWSKFRIIKMIVYEAVFICLIGGIFGNILGLLQMWILNRINIVGTGWIPVFISFEMFIESVILALIIGILSAILPALIASNLLPAEALRYE